MSHQEWVKLDNHVPLVVPDVQATEHQTNSLGDPKQAQAVVHHDRCVVTEVPTRMASTIHERIDKGIFMFHKRISS